MFNSLKEKLTSWFKKPEEKKEEPIKEIIPEEKPKKGKKERKQTEKDNQTQEEPIQSMQEWTESPELSEKPKESKSFLKKIFSKKKKDEIIPEKQEETKPAKTKNESLQSQLEQLEETILETQEPEEKPKKGKKEVEEKIKKELVPIAQIPKLEVEVEEKIKIKKEEPEKKISKKIEEKGFFSKLASKLSTSTLSQEQFDDLFQELEIILLENNVALDVVEKIHDELSKDLVGIEIKKSNIESTIVKSLKETILNLLFEPPDLIKSINKKLGVYTIIFVGINGSGKTTSIAKLANYLKQNKISCVLAAADTFRAASIEQLEKHAEKLNVPIIRHQYGADPAAVAFDAKKYAEAHKIKVLLIDTAGRMYTKSNLIKEMEKIVKVSKPDLKIFVGESITGNDATEQAKAFNESIDIDGIILSKADVDEKAGTILSVSYVTKKPIYFLGTGQKYSDLTPFTKKEILKHLGLG